MNVRSQRTAVFWHAPSQRLRDARLRIVLTLVRKDDVCVRLASVFLFYKWSITVILVAPFR